MPFTYKLICENTGYFYIGSTKGALEKRIARHLDSLRLGNHHNVRLQELYNSTPCQFKVQYRMASLAKARELESLLINKHRNNRLCVNILLGSSGGDTYTNNPNKDVIIQKRTATQRSSITEMTKQQRVDRWGRVGDKNGMYGRKHTKRTKKLQSKIAKQKGFGCQNKGIKRSDAAKKRYRAAALSNVNAEGYTNAFAGKHHTDETKQLLSTLAKARAATGIKPSNARPVRIDGETFASYGDAAKAKGTVPATILNRCRSTNFPTYEFLN